jgi:hypothetical protein
VHNIYAHDGPHDKEPCRVPEERHTERCTHIV